MVHVRKSDSHIINQEVIPLLFKPVHLLYSFFRQTAECSLRKFEIYLLRIDFIFFQYFIDTRLKILTQELHHRYFHGNTVNIFSDRWALMQKSANFIQYVYVHLRNGPAVIIAGNKVMPVQPFPVRSRKKADSLEGSDLLFSQLEHRNIAYLCRSVLNCLHGKTDKISEIDIPHEIYLIDLYNHLSAPVLRFHNHFVPVYKIINAAELLRVFQHPQIEIHMNAVVFELPWSAETLHQFLHGLLCCFRIRSAHHHYICIIRISVQKHIFSVYLQTVCHHFHQILQLNVSKCLTHGKYMIHTDIDGDKRLFPVHLHGCTGQKRPAVKYLHLFINHFTRTLDRNIGQQQTDGGKEPFRQHFRKSRLNNHSENDQENIAHHDVDHPSLQPFPAAVQYNQPAQYIVTAEQIKQDHERRPVIKSCFIIIEHDRIKPVEYNQREPCKKCQKYREEIMSESYRNIHHGKHINQIERCRQKMKRKIKASCQFLSVWINHARLRIHLQKRFCPLRNHRHGNRSKQCKKCMILVSRHPLPE